MANARTLTTDQFIQQAMNKHGDTYDYSITNYIGMKHYIDFICPKHGNMKQLGLNHIRYGCNKCAGKGRTVDELISEMKSVHGERFQYKRDFNKSSDYTTIICSIHGDFKMVVNQHLMGKACRKCYNDWVAVSRHRTTEQWIQSAKKIHGDLYDYSVSNYISAKDKILINCLKHGIFEQAAHSHLRGAGCYKCSLSNSSSAEHRWLQMLGIDSQYRNVRHKVGKKTMIFDGFDEGTKTVYEFYGDYWHGNPKTFDPADINKHNKKTFGDLYIETIEREAILRKNGFRIVSIWESDWKKYLLNSDTKTLPEFSDFSYRHSLECREVFDSTSVVNHILKCFLE